MTASSLPRQQLLLVDDEEDALLELAELLEGEGFVCHTATSVKLALHHLTRHPDIALVITDLRMGHIDGLDLIRQVRESVRAAMPFIIVSGDADVKDAIAAMHLSVVDFLLKPIDTGKLLALVKHELGIEP